LWSLRRVNLALNLGEKNFKLLSAREFTVDQEGVLVIEYDSGEGQRGSKVNANWDALLLRSDDINSLLRRPRANQFTLAVLGLQQQQEGTECQMFIEGLPIGDLA